MGCPASIGAYRMTGTPKTAQSPFLLIGTKPFLRLNRNLSPCSKSAFSVPHELWRTEDKVSLLPVLLAFSSSAWTFPDPSAVLIWYGPCTFQEPNPVFQGGLSHAEFSSLVLAGLALVYYKIALAFSPSWSVGIFLDFWFWNSFILLEKVRRRTKYCSTYTLRPAYVLTFYPIAFIALCVFPSKPFEINLQTSCSIPS